MVLKLMPDYHCHPVWEIREDGLVNVDPQALPITAGLKTKLLAWAKQYDETFDRQNPGSSGFPSGTDRGRFDSQGRVLWQELQRELGRDEEVTYFSVAEARTLCRS